MTKVEELITARFEELPTQQRRAARFILDHQDDVALHSMREVATQAGLPAVTFVRLARALGFDNYLGLRALFQDKVRQGDSTRRFTLRAQQIQRGQHTDDSSSLVGKIFAGDVQNIQQTYDRNAQGNLLAAVRLLEDAPRVYVLGQRSCFPAAYLFHYVVRLFRQDTILVQGSAGTVADDLRGIGRADALMAYSVEPYTAEVVRATRYAKAQGSRLVAVTDNQLSPIGRIADETLLVCSETPSFFHSVTALTTLTQALLALLVARGGDRAVAAISGSESQLDRFGAYWHDDGPDRR